MGAGADIHVDVAGLRRSAGRYRELAEVADSVSVDLRGHLFGAWATDEDGRGDLRVRHQVLAERLAALLDADARRSDSLADSLHTTVSTYTGADAETAAGLTSSSAGSDDTSGLGTGEFV